MRYEEPERDPWERQKGESLRAFEGFRQYRDMDPLDRSIRKCVRQNHPPEKYKRLVETFKRWSAENDWVKRVEAWDDEVDRATRATHMNALKEMRERHVKAGRAMQQLAVVAMERVRHAMDRSEKYVPPPGVVPQLMTQGTQIERLALGEPTTIAGVHEKERYVVTWGDEGFHDDPDDDDEEPGTDQDHAAAAAPDAEEDPGQ